MPSLLPESAEKRRAIVGDKQLWHRDARTGQARLTACSPARVFLPTQPSPASPRSETWAARSPAPSWERTPPWTRPSLGAREEEGCAQGLPSFSGASIHSGPAGNGRPVPQKCCDFAAGGEHGGGPQAGDVPGVEGSGRKGPVAAPGSGSSLGKGPGTRDNKLGASGTSVRTAEYKPGESNQDLEVPGQGSGDSAPSPSWGLRSPVWGSEIEGWLRGWSCERAL